MSRWDEQVLLEVASGWRLGMNETDAVRRLMDGAGMTMTEALLWLSRIDIEIQIAQRFEERFVGGKR